MEHSRVQQASLIHDSKWQSLAVVHTYVWSETRETQTSDMTVSMHCKRPLCAAPSTLDIAVPISSQAAAWAPSTGSKSRDMVFEKYWSNEKKKWENFKGKHERFSLNQN